MLEVTARWDTETLELMQRALETAPEKADHVLRTKVRPYASRRVNATLRKAPPAQPWSKNNPPPWTSERQKFAYWATGGWGMAVKGPGIHRTKRTGRHVKSWHVRADYKKDFGLLTIYSDDPRGPFITGIYQQRFHRLAGWPYAPEIIEDILIESEFVFVEGLLDILWEGLF